MRPRVLVSVPNTGWIHKHCVFALLKMTKDERVDLTVMLSTHVPYVNNLNKIVLDFLRDGYDWWITFDDDNPPQNNPIDLIFLQKDIIGCPTPVWHCDATKPKDLPYYFNALDAVSGGYKPHLVCEGLQRVDAVGSGCMVIARRVLEKVKAPFMRIWDADGTVDTGHDYNFCERAKRLGFEVFAHYDYPCMHFNEVELTEAITAFRGALNG